MLEHFLTPPDQYHNLLILNSIYFLASPLILHAFSVFRYTVHLTELVYVVRTSQR